MDTTLILPEWLIISPLQPPEHRFGVCVQDGRILKVAANDELRREYPEAEIVRADGGVCAPGFVDTHTHLYGVLAHGIPLPNAPSGFWSFLNDFWWPMVENRLTQEMIGAATAVQTARMIQSGITAFYDCTEAPNALPGVLQRQAEVVRKSGLRAILSFEATQRISPQNGEQGLRENLHFIQACADEELVRGMMCLHTTFTCSEDFIRRAFELAEQTGTLTHLHLSEGSFEPAYCLEHFGMRPVELYDRLGVLSNRMLASQCVQLSEQEIERTALRNVRISHMPLSNCEVGGGIAPVPDYLAAGLNVGLGSDGYITDFFEVMRGAFLIHKAARQNPQVMPAWQVWYMATEGGARLLDFEQVGRLSPGFRADLQLIQPVLPTPLTRDNLYEQILLYAHASDVRAVMVNGRWLMREGSLLHLDYHDALQQAHRAAVQLWNVDNSYLLPRSDGREQTL
jgi:cytosine/adenosine deaminase-related metal-dependent hydrolase